MEDKKNKKLSDEKLLDKIIKGANKSFEILDSKINKVKDEKDKRKD
jgi:hypothetical protein